MKRVDAYLSRKAQAFCPSALVYCEVDASGVTVFILERQDNDTLVLGMEFGDAKASLDAMKHAFAARGKVP